MLRIAHLWPHDPLCEGTVNCPTSQKCEGGKLELADSASFQHVRKESLLEVSLMSQLVNYLKRKEKLTSKLESHAPETLLYTLEPPSSS